MLVPTGNHPSVPPVFEPMALHADPSHFATWSAWAMLSTFDPSVPTNTSVPLELSPRTYASSAQPQIPPPVPIACHPLPLRYATLSAAGMFSRLPNLPPA